jgi:hypothetical protein
VRVHGRHGRDAHARRLDDVDGLDAHARAVVGGRGRAGPMAILLVLGVMDLRAMAVVAAAITLERLAPAGERIARTLGALAVGAGLLLLARAATLR